MPFSGVLRAADDVSRKETAAALLGHRWSRQIGNAISMRK